MLQRIQQPRPAETRGKTPSLSDKYKLVLLRALHNKQDLQLYVPSKGQSNNGKSVLLNGHKCHDKDLNPHSADQKNQSLSPVHLTAPPRHDNKVHCFGRLLH